ncbi:MAG TPA: helix-turn-helix transcriptional regulator [Mucilaginibacter sp.]|jgi:transcriptional regulator with XRE-family HTH domain|nr:helix-turn-helix transcriptional regulator [Mucilaginibacter sp.]
MNNKFDTKIKAIAAIIRSKREEKNYTQEYLAYKLDISQNAYSKIELGYTKITVERLFQIAEILEINAAEILDADIKDAEQELLLNGTD